VAIIQIINVSNPNDGLGDTLRDSQVKVNDNFSELNAKKVEKVIGFDLSENNFSNAEKLKLENIQENAQVNVRGNLQQKNPDAPDYILGKPTNGKIITYGNYSLIGQDLTIFAGWVWQINDVLYSNSNDIIINFPYADMGLQRFDLVVFNTLNNAQRVDGDEDSVLPIVPFLLDDTVLFGTVLITDDSIGSISIPSNNNITYIDYPPLTADGVQDFEVPLGRTIKQMFINGSLQVLETENNLTRNDTFTQSNTTITLKQPTYIGNYITGFYQ